MAVTIRNCKNSGKSFKAKSTNNFHTCGKTFKCLEDNYSESDWSILSPTTI